MKNLQLEDHTLRHPGMVVSDQGVEQPSLFHHRARILILEISTCAAF